MDNCGRKLALQIASIPIIVGWTMIAFSRTQMVLLLGRLIAGISVGLTAAAGQVRIMVISFRVRFSKSRTRTYFYP